MDDINQEIRERVIRIEAKLDAIRESLGEYKTDLGRLEGRVWMVLLVALSSLAGAVISLIRG